MSITENYGIKLLSCVALSLQNTLLILGQRYSRSVLHESYSNNSYVLMMELTKLLWCTCYILYIGNNLQHVYKLIRTSLPMAIPGCIYVVQNTFYYISLEHLDGSVFAIFSQLKILTTAVAAGIILGQQQSVNKWRALILLVVGAILVQYPRSDGSTLVMDDIGVICVLSSTVCSALAGVYLEKYLKSSELNLWERNIQLSFYGVILAFISLTFSERDTVLQTGILHGYSLFTWLLVIIAALGGLIVAVVVKYTSTIIKGFASSASIILISICSVYMFNTSIDLLFALGATCVIISIFNYSEPSASATTNTNNPKTSNDNNAYSNNNVDDNNHQLQRQRVTSRDRNSDDYAVEIPLVKV